MVEGEGPEGEEVEVSDSAVSDMSGDTSADVGMTARWVGVLSYIRLQLDNRDIDSQ